MSRFDDTELHEVFACGHTMKLRDFRGSITLAEAQKELLREGSMRAMLSPPEDYDGYLVDVGANVGMWSVLWAMHYPRAYVVAVEPVPETAALLERNLLANAPGKNWRVVTKAVAPAKWRGIQIPLRVPPTNPGAASTVYPHAGDVRALMVPTVTLDDLLAGKRVGVMKVDVEGLEYEILLDFASRLGEQVEMLHVELHGIAGLPPLLQRNVYATFYSELLRHLPAERIYCPW